MIGRKKIQEIHTREYLKRQRLLARKHRRYMRLRESSRVKKKHPVLKERKPRKVVNLFSTLHILFSTAWFYLREFFLRLRTHISIGLLDVRLFFKKTFSGSTARVRAIIAGLTSLIPLFVFKREVINQNNMKQRKPIKKHRTKVLKQEKKKKPTKSFFGFLRKLFIFGLVLFALALGAFFIWFSTLEIPSIDNFENRKISNSTKIYDRTGEVLLYDIHEDIRRTVVDFDEIHQSAKDAIVAIEDHNFYEHNGVVWKSTLRALTQTALSKIGLSNEGTAGGSTLTQQVVKNTLLNRDRVISRKVKEWVLAYKIESILSKDEILEIYLNEAPYGGTVYGIEEASKRFFGVPASEVSIAQSAYLAAIPNLPTFFSPYGPNKDKLDQRARTVLTEMRRYNFISNAEYENALAEDVVFIAEEEGFAKSLHFVQFVRAQLEDTYGIDMVQNGGLSVITTLDYELQQQAEDIILEHIEDVEEPFDASNAALVAIDSATGQIISMVGSRDYFDTDGFDGNFNVAISPRQPGSSFKPFAYATAFEKGYLPESTIFDTQTQFNSRCEPTDTTSADGCYSPNNYDFNFKGPLTWRAALAQSRNIPAIKINYLAGISNVIQKAKDLGITSLNQPANFYGLGLVLGGGEVSLLEMTAAYGVFSNDGVKNKTTAILEVKDVNGEVIEKYVSQEERVLDKNAARMVNSILSDNVARTPLFGSQSFLYFGDRAVAGKTGTTNDNRDAWLIGYTPDVTVGVWTGNNDNSPMKKGSSISGKPWRKYMDEVIKNYEKSSFGEYSLPDNFDSLPNMIKGDWYGGTTISIDSVSGKLATEFTPKEAILEIPQPDPHTILHWINKNNPLVRDDSRNDPQYNNWEFSVNQYRLEKLGGLLDVGIEIPTEYDDVHLPNGEIAPTQDIVEFEIVGVDEEEVYDRDESLELRLRNIKNRDDIALVQLFINNAFISSDESSPYSFEFIPDDLPYFEEDNIARIIVTNVDGVKTSQEVSFILDL